MTTTRVLGGRYRLVERLGQGGMSVVWRGYDEVLGRPVAVKVLTARYAAHVPSADRIRMEAQAAARLSHPHVTGVYDYGETVTESDEQLPYVVMELLSGRTLADQLKHQGPLPVPVALLACAQVASALAAAHACGLVHRDVKPSNVMLTSAGVKVMDFGLAAEVGTIVDGDVIGTPAYLAPERLTTGEAEPASDVYGLGMLLFGALTGRLPWRVETAAEMLAAHQFVKPARLPAKIGLPRGVRSLYDRCLAKNPLARPSAHQVASGLSQAALRRRQARPWAALAAVGSGPVVDGVLEIPVVRAVVQVAVEAPEVLDEWPDEAEWPDEVDQPLVDVAPEQPDGPTVADVEALAGEPVDLATIESVDAASANRWGGATVVGAAAVVVAALVGGFIAPSTELILPDIPAPVAEQAEPVPLTGPPAPATTDDSTGLAPNAPGLPVPEDLVRVTDDDDAAGGGGEAPGAGSGSSGSGSGSNSGSGPNAGGAGADPPGGSDSGSDSDPTPPEESDPDPTDPPPPDPDPDPEPGPVTQTVNTVAGSLDIKCEGGNATLVSANLLADYVITEPGPAPEVRVGLLGIDVVAVGYSAGSPTVSLGAI